MRAVFLLARVPTTVLAASASRRPPQLSRVSLHVIQLNLAHTGTHLLGAVLICTDSPQGSVPLSSVLDGAWLKARFRKLLALVMVLGKHFSREYLEPTYIYINIYVYVYVYVYVPMYVVHMYACMQCMHVCMYAVMYVSYYVCMYACMHAFLYAVRMHVCMHVGITVV